MHFNVNRITVDKDFFITGMSYIGAPKSNTAMFITKKVEHLLIELEGVEECLIFAENGISVPASLLVKHAFVFSDKPNLEYARFATQFEEERFKEENKIEFTLMPQGYWVTRDVCVPEDAYIEPGCVIGPDVQIGRGARILAGTVIKHSTIGHFFLSNQYAVIGANGFTMAEDEQGNKFRIPTLGRVVIGDHVEIGANDNIPAVPAGIRLLKIM